MINIFLIVYLNFYLIVIVKTIYIYNLIKKLYNNFNNKLFLLLF